MLFSSHICFNVNNKYSIFHILHIHFDINYSEIMPLVFLRHAHLLHIYTMLSSFVFSYLLSYRYATNAGR